VSEGVPSGGLLLNENQPWEGFYFFGAIFLLYVRCHALSECCKTHLSQIDRIVGFFFFYFIFMHFFLLYLIY
jgi:hypothetical protein